MQENLSGTSNGEWASGFEIDNEKDCGSCHDDDDDKDDNNNSENDDDVNFIATEKEVQQELAEISREKQLQLTCLETDYEKKPKKRARLRKNNKDVNPLDNVD